MRVGGVEGIEEVVELPLVVHAVAVAVGEVEARPVHPLLAGVGQPVAVGVGGVGEAEEAGVRQPDGVGADDIGVRDARSVGGRRGVRDARGGRGLRRRGQVGAGDEQVDPGIIGIKRDPPRVRPRGRNQGGGEEDVQHAARERRARRPRGGERDAVRIGRDAGEGQPGQRGGRARRRAGRAPRPRRPAGAVDAEILPEEEGECHLDMRGQEILPRGQPCRTVNDPVRRPHAARGPRQQIMVTLFGVEEVWSRAVGAVELGDPVRRPDAGVGGDRPERFAGRVVKEHVAAEVVRAQERAPRLDAVGFLRHEPRQELGREPRGRGVQGDDAAVQPDPPLRVRHEHARAPRQFALQFQRHVQRRGGRPVHGSGAGGGRVRRFRVFLRQRMDRCENETCGHAYRRDKKHKAFRSSCEPPRGMGVPPMKHGQDARVTLVHDGFCKSFFLFVICSAVFHCRPFPSRKRREPRSVPHKRDR